VNTSVLASWWAMSLLCVAFAFGAHRGQKRYGLTGGGATLLSWMSRVGVILALGTFVVGLALALVL
jgi:hypothetical protein